jgi:hypothetical protein
MTFEEFESYAKTAIAAFAAVRKLVSEKDGLGSSGLTAANHRQIEKLQEEAAVALGAIDHIIDRFGNRICVFGQGNREVDMFRESLSITGSCGSAILDTAIAELRLLVGRLRSRVSTLSGDEVSRFLSGGFSRQRNPLPTSSSSVFIVHGHDGEAREAVARFVAKVGFDPVILHEQASAGQTIIEKLEAHNEVSFAIVLFTPDDLGATGTTTPPTLKPRARQNVVLELGSFIGTLGRNRVCVLYRPDVELPSDMLGVVYVPYDSSGSWRLGLARELKAAGLKIDTDRLL